MLRTRYFDDRLDEQLSRGCRQVVILALASTPVGCVSKCPALSISEIDDEDILNFKKERLVEAGIEAPIVYIPATMSPTTYSACLTPTASILTSRAMSFGKATPCI